MDPTRPAIVAEVALNLAGAGILCSLAYGRYAGRRRTPSALSDWDLPAVDFLLFLALALATGFVAQVMLGLAIRRVPLDSDTRLVFGGAAMDLGVLAGAAVFQLIVRRWRLALAGNLGRILSGGRRVIVVENNHSGQFARYLRSETGFSAHGHIRKYDGEPFMPHHIVEAVREQLAGTTTISVPEHEVMV